MITTTTQEQPSQAGAPCADGPARPPAPARGLFGIRTPGGAASPAGRRLSWLEAARTLV